MWVYAMAYRQFHIMRRERIAETVLILYILDSFTKFSSAVILAHVIQEELEAYTPPRHPLGKNRSKLKDRRNRAHPLY